MSLQTIQPCSKHLPTRKHVKHLHISLSVLTLRDGSSSNWAVRAPAGLKAAPDIRTAPAVTSFHSPKIHRQGQHNGPDRLAQKKGLAE